MKKNIYIGFTLTIASAMLLLFQNCGKVNNGQIPVADDKIVLEDFNIVNEECAQETCKVTVAKMKTSNSKENTPPIKEISKGSGGGFENYPAVEYDFSNKLNITDEEIPSEFYRHDGSTGAYQKCVLVNRRDDIRYEYLCNK